MKLLYRRKLLQNSGAFIMALIFLSGSLFSWTGEVVSKFKAPAAYSTGMTFDGKNIWVADRKTDKIYCIDRNSGKILKQLESPGYWPMGLAFDGKYIWNADVQGRSDISENRDGMIHKIDPKTGAVLRTLRAPSSSPRGLTYDGKYLWCTDERKKMIIQFSTEDGTTINSFPSPSSAPMGICWDGKYLWVSDRLKDEIYMVDPKTGYVIIVTEAPGKYTRGLTYDGKNLWAVDYQTDMIYKLKVRDGVKYRKTDMKKQRVVLAHQMKVFGPGKVKDLDLVIAIPEDRTNQRLIGKIKYSRKPDQIKTDKWGQRTAHFKYNNLKPGTTALAEMTVDFRSWNVRYFIYPEKVKSLNTIPADIKAKYLGDNEKYQINSPIIQKTVKKVVGNEKNAYWIIRKLHQFLIGHLYYNMDGAWDTAPTVIRNGHGSCSEYSFVFISLCKAAGIPTRYVGATWIKKDTASMDQVYHRWIEVYLPGYGWVPTDPTHGDRKTPRDQAFPIGLCRNSCLITTQSGGGSETMEWTYNFNEFYTTEPKTNLNIEHFGDWEPLK